MKTIPIFMALALFCTWHSSAAAKNPLSRKQVNTAIQTIVSKINAQAPMSRGAWVFMKARYKPSAKKIYYRIKDTTVTAAQISAAKYRKLMTGPLMRDVCGKQTTFKKYGIDVVYRISDRRNKHITTIHVDTARC